MSGDTLTLTRFAPPPEGRYEESAETLRGVFVDCETTGLNHVTDKIIQLAITPFTFTKDGLVCDVGVPYVGLEAPGCPIPPRIVRLTGITDAMVEGQWISYAEVGLALNDMVLVVAHNAGFDRPFLEKRFPLFEELCWGCSMVDVPWEDEGYTSKKLEWLAFKHCGMFFDAHQADADSAFGVHLLSTALSSGKRVLASVLEGARASYVRIYAQGAPFDLKDVLKARGYRWNSGEDGMPKAWLIDVKVRDSADELAWLKANVPCSPRQMTFDAYTRFSSRIGQRKSERGTA